MSTTPPTIQVNRSVLTIKLGAIPVDTGGGGGDNGPDLEAIEALTGTGILARTAADTWALRSIAAGDASIAVTNPAGVAGNPTLTAGPDLVAIEALTGTGVPERTAADTWALRPHWQYSRLSADVSSSTTTMIDSGMSFTPEANKTYIVDVWMIVTYDVPASAGLRFMFTDPSAGVNYSAQHLSVPTSVTAQVLRFGALGTAVFGTSGTTDESLVKGQAMLITGNNPAGSCSLQFSCELNSPGVTIIAGSFMRWLEIA